MIFQPWMKTTLIALGIIVFIGMVVFLYLLIAGADESRKKENTLKKAMRVEEWRN